MATPGPSPQPVPTISEPEPETPGPIPTLTPGAPPPKAASKQLPDSTPAASHTPTSRPDVSEFDPFTATPTASSSSATTDTPAARPPTSAAMAAGPSVVTATPKKADEPAFNFSGFLRDLRTKPAEPIARYLKSFLSNFAKKPFTVNEQIKLIHDFLRFIGEKMIHVEPWKSQSSAEFDNALEAVEKLVMNRLYNYTFTPQLVPSQPITTDDLDRDAVFGQRVRLFGWVRERHLDVPEGEASQGFLGFAEQELLKINHYKAPRDKMICILNSCKVIFGLIRHTVGSGPESTSADAFIPILIFVVLRANPDNMISNIEYINRFRSQSKLQGEAGYYLSSLSGAIAFIETMDASSLSNITQEEFEKNVERAIQELPPSPSSERSRPFPESMSPFDSTPGEEAARPLVFPTLDNTRKFFQRTSNIATEAVSKPLNAIGKIFDGIQRDDDPDGSDTLHTPRRNVSARATTPDTPTRRFAQMDLDSTTDVPLPEFAQVQGTIDAEVQNRANVQTLHQMFPALDEEVVEAVLESCGDDLGIAIDRLLEM